MEGITNVMTNSTSNRKKIQSVNHAREIFARKEREEAALDSAPDGYDSCFGTVEQAEDMRLGMSADKENQRDVNRGLLNKNTGKWIGRTDKGNTIVKNNLAPSMNYLNNFDSIKWDTPQSDTIKRRNLAN